MPKKSSVKRLSQEVKSPAAYDRHFKLPIFHDELPKGVLGTWERFGDASEDKLLAAQAGSPEAITISSEVPQTYSGNEENLWNKVMKHELVHALQSKLVPEGQVHYQNVAPPPTYGLKIMEKLFGDPVQDYRRKLREFLPYKEIDAYTLSDTFKGTDFPQDQVLIDEARRRQLQKLRQMGLGKEAKIWE